MSVSSGDFSSNFNAYLNDIPMDCGKLSLEKFGFGCFIGFIKYKTISRGLITGTAFGTAELVRNLTAPILKKIPNKTIQEAINTFTCNIIVVSISSGNPILGLAAGTILGTFKIFSEIISSSVSFIDKSDCEAAGMAISNGFLFLGNLRLGLIVGASIFSARLVCKFVYPFFASRIEQYKIFEELGLKSNLDRLPQGWGLGILNKLIHMYSFSVQLTGTVSIQRIGMISFTLIMATYNYITSVKENENIPLFSAQRGILDANILSLENFILNS